MTTPSDPVPDIAHELTMTLSAEEVEIVKRARRTVVQASRTTSVRDKLVEVDLAHEQVVVERVPVGRVVDAVPPVRQDGDVTIMPVVEEEVVVVRRLVLREEVHVRRVRATKPHVETVSVRRQDLTVTRHPLDGETPTPDHGVDPATQQEGSVMNQAYTASDETIVAVYDTAAHAEAAVAALKQAGVPADSINIHAGGDAARTTTAGMGEPVREQGFWASLFGGTPSYDTDVYDRSVAAGSTVVSVRTPDSHVDSVLTILESHHPIDIDDRAASYGLMQDDTTRQGAVQATPAATTGTAHATGATGAIGRAGEEVIQLAEETLAVGKRVVNRGGTRIRRYVVETPVEERVTLHEERVVVDRHPVTDGRAVTPDFTDKTIELTETAEEAVISKKARVVEEIGLRKEVSDRVETVRDTVRKEEAEIVQIPAETTTTTTTTGGVGGTAARPKV